MDLLLVVMQIAPKNNLFTRCALTVEKGLIYPELNDLHAKRRIDMVLWNYCAICGERIEAGKPCIGIKENTELCGDSICFACAKIENLPDGKDTMTITDLLARAEAAEARAAEAEASEKR